MRDVNNQEAKTLQKQAEIFVKILSRKESFKLVVEPVDTIGDIKDTVRAKAGNIPDRPLVVKHMGKPLVDSCRMDSEGIPQFPCFMCEVEACRGGAAPIT